MLALEVWANSSRSDTVEALHGSNILIRYLIALLIPPSLAIAGEPLDATQELPIQTKMKWEIKICAITEETYKAVPKSRKDAAWKEVVKCSNDSNERVKERFRNELALATSESQRAALKTLYSSYLTYMESVVDGKGFDKSAEALGFSKAANDYVVELDL